MEATETSSRLKPSIVSLLKKGHSLFIKKKDLLQRGS